MSQKGVPLAAARVGDDGACHDISQRFIALDLAHAVPAVRVFGVDQVQHPDEVAVFGKIRGKIFVELRFWVGDNHTFTASDTAQKLVMDKSPALHSAGAAAQRCVAVEQRILREGHRLFFVLSQKGAVDFADVSHLQQLVHGFLVHVAGGSIYPFLGKGDVSLRFVQSARRQAQLHNKNDEQPEQGNADAKTD